MTRSYHSVSSILGALPRTVPARSDNAIATTVPLVTAPPGQHPDELEVWNSIIIAERMLATAHPASQDGMRFLLGMIAPDRE